MRNYSILQDAYLIWRKGEKGRIIEDFNFEFQVQGAPHVLEVA